MNVQLSRNDDGVLEAQCDAPNWTQGESLVEHLKQSFGARIVDYAEGPDARSWKLEITGEEVVVYQWDTGDISFFGKSPNAENLTTKLAESVRQMD